MSNKRVAIVTGGNKGVGYGIVKALLKQFNGVVYLTSRNEQLGRSAVETLQKEVVSPQADLRYHQLDISDEVSVKRLLKHMQDEHGGIDVLINNAGIAYKYDSTSPFAEQAEVTNKTNYFDTKLMCIAALPFLKENARMVNVSSQAGLLCHITNAELKKRLKSDDLTVNDVDAIVKDFNEKAKTETHTQSGYPNNSYQMSKIALCAFTRILARQAVGLQKGILVTSCTPGYTNTDMTSGKGVLTIDEGAVTPTWLALISAGEGANMSGKFFMNQKEKEWDSPMESFRPST